MDQPEPTVVEPYVDRAPWLDEPRPGDPSGRTWRESCDTAGAVRLQEIEARTETWLQGVPLLPRDEVVALVNELASLVPWLYAYLPKIPETERDYPALLAIGTKEAAYAEQAAIVLGLKR